ncbi:hypothetical protein F2Q69_00011100 [Brassica cretica]|uniref:At2g35280-like TPR domain-containing protein n=2 Tax=Brassica cretica TaxID=69181 RepID=A0A8S9R8Z1_BRACR|nr:hypothetical protein F2Q69_00011100 [Brassica cretica]
MLTLESMPEDMRLFIVSKMASTSLIEYFNTIITCKRLSFGPDNYSVAKALNLSPLVNQPSLANRYQTLVDRCLETNNIDAHFVKGMLEYFESQNQIIGLLHIHIASKGGHVQGTYVYGVLLMAIGETENGVKIINKLTDGEFSVVEDCMANFQRSMERPFFHMKETYVSSMKTMWPHLNCHPQEGADTTVCSNCFHFFLLTKFYKTMLGFNDLLD